MTFPTVRLLPQDALSEFFAEVTREGFGKRSKIEYDTAVVRLMARTGYLPRNPTVEDIVDGLRVPVAKAFRLWQDLGGQEPKENP